MRRMSVQKEKDSPKRNKELKIGREDEFDKTLASDNKTASLPKQQSIKGK